MKDLGEVKKESKEFLEEGYGSLPELIKMNANAYMRGLRDGATLAQNAERERPNETAVV